jgi:hypothetical protein
LTLHLNQTMRGFMRVSRRVMEHSENEPRMLPVSARMVMKES